MKIELESEFMYQLKDAVMVAFLKDDLETTKQNLADSRNEVDIKYDKKLVKAYRTILKYYGEKDE